MLRFGLRVIWAMSVRAVTRAPARWAATRLSAALTDATSPLRVPRVVDRLISVSDYQFEQPCDTACITCSHVLNDGAPVLFVTHDADDGGWQFLCGAEHDIEDATVIGMGSVIDLDPTLNGLHDMPEGYGATRDALGARWEAFRSG